MTITFEQAPALVEGILDGFLKPRPGSATEAIARDAAILVSIALQYGAALETIRAALTKDHDGSPATAIGAALDKLGEAP